MDINLTLLGQMITFLLFVAFTMKYVWPPVTAALTERKKNIADGLAAAERGHRDLALARQGAVGYLKKAKIQANEIIEKSTDRAAQIVENAKQESRVEAEKIMEVAKKEIEAATLRAKLDIKKQVVGVALQVAEKLVSAKMDTNTNRKMVEKFAEEMI